MNVAGERSARLVVDDAADPAPGVSRDARPVALLVAAIAVLGIAVATGVVSSPYVTAARPSPAPPQPALRADSPQQLRRAVPPDWTSTTVAGITFTLPPALRGEEDSTREANVRVVSLKRTDGTMPYVVTVYVQARVDDVLRRFGEPLSGRMFILGGRPLLERTFAAKLGSGPIGFNYEARHVFVQMGSSVVDVAALPGFPPARTLPSEDARLQDLIAAMARAGS